METKVLVKKYKLLEPLATGGMATVYLAKNLATDEIVVAKIPNFAGLPNREKLERRFMREAQILSKINSRYVVKIHDFGKDELTSEFFLILEYLHGKTLEEIAASKERIPIPTVVDLVYQMAEVLGDLHEQGIVHRDIKSSNIKISSDGNIKLFDFGISKGEDLPSMTRSTDFLGTLQYMSPEQTDGREVDIRSDIYSLGIVMYEMLFGKLPFDAPSPVEVIEMQRHKQPKIPPEARERGVPASLLTLMHRCLEKKPEDRFQTPSELLVALKTVIDDIGMSKSERDSLRRTKLTQIASKSPVPTFKARAKKRQFITIILALLMVVAAGATLWFSRGCFSPIVPDFTVIQGEIAQYQLPIGLPFGTQSVNATVTNIPNGLSVKLEKANSQPNGDSGTVNWILSIYANLTTPLDTYKINLNVNYLKEGNVSTEDNKEFVVEVTKGNIGSRALKLVSRDQVVSDPNAKIDYAVSIDGKVFVPIDVISDSTKAQTEWDKAQGKLTYITPDKTIELKEGEKTVKENGVQKEISDAPVIVNDSMLVSDKVAENQMDTDVQVKGDNVDLTYKQPKPGSKVSVTTKDQESKEIKGASVFINNSYKGKTPFSIELPIGTFQISITLDRYETVTDELVLKTIKTVSQEYILIKTSKPPENKMGTLNLYVNVPWGDFIVDGAVYRNTKSVSLELPIGNHRIVYKLNGFENKSETLNVSGGEVTNYWFKISSGILTVTCNIGATVYIDGAPQGTNITTSPQNPFTMEIAAQTYTISVSRGGYKTITKKVAVPAGQNTKVHFELAKQ